MKSLALVLLCLAVNLAHGVHPILKVMQMLTEMQQRIIRQGDDVQRMYEKFSGWCADRSRELHQEIKLAKASIANMEGIMEKESDKIVSFDTKIGELSAQLSTDESDLKAIVLIRDKEKGEFDKNQIELREMISALQHAIAILERQMKEGASFAQIQRTGEIMQVFQTILDASSLGDADASALTALVQSASGSDEAADEDEDDASLGAPDPDAYQRKSSSIVETLESLLDKAQTELDEERTAEHEKQTNFLLLKQVLEDRIKIQNRGMESTKKAKAEAGETKATNEGDLSVTKTDVAEDIHTLGGLHHKCMAKAQDFQQETKGRKEELNALAKAKSIINDMVKAPSLAQDSAQDSDDEATSDTSFMQVQQKHRAGSGTPLSVKIVHMLKKRAAKLKSTVLAQLVQNLASSIRSAVVETRNPLASVQQLITDMIKTLEKEAGEAADHKAYCDKELSYAAEKEQNKVDDSEGLTTRVDKMQAQSAQLSGQLATLQQELSEITKTQTEMDKIREEEKANFNKVKPELEESIKAVQTAMAVLRDYYANGDISDEQSSGSGGIIGMLEVVESDFSKQLSTIVAEEESAQASYEETTKENEVAKAAKGQDVKFKTSRSKTLAKAGSEMATDRDGMQTEIEATREYLARLKSICIAKPEPYEERKARREAELASLREALELLFPAAGSSLVQESSSTRRLLRGGTQKHLEP